MIKSSARTLTGNLNAPRKVIKGTVKINGVPAERLVNVYAGVGGSLLAQKLSQPDGRYSFVLPNNPSYMIVAIDHKRQFNAVIQDNVVLK
jgi:hypothetical protein